MLEVSPMGPGFFIFFRDVIESKGGSGGKGRKSAYRREVSVDKAFANHEQQQLVINDITEILDGKGEELLPVTKIVSPERITEVVDRVIAKYDPLPAMQELDFSRLEALTYTEDYIRMYIEQRNQNAIALILIMAAI